MLILTRKTGQDVVIRVGDVVIEVKVASMLSDRVRLGFTATKRVEINRREIDEKRGQSRPATSAATEP